MAGLFNKNTQVQQRSQKEILTSRYFSARHNILLLVIFTLVNVFLLVTNADSYYLFSAFIPYLLIDLGRLLCGMYPAEFYAQNFPGMEFLNISFFVICIIIAAVILLLYLVSWLLSKKPRVGWMIFALVFIAIDTIAMLLWIGDFLESIMDILFHLWAVLSLTRGVISYYKAKKLPDEPEPEITLEENPEPVEEVVE